MAFGPLKLDSMLFRQSARLQFVWSRGAEDRLHVIGLGEELTRHQCSNYNSMLTSPSD